MIAIIQSIHDLFCIIDRVIRLHYLRIGVWLDCLYGIFAHAVQKTILQIIDTVQDNYGQEIDIVIKSLLFHDAYVETSDEEKHHNNEHKDGQIIKEDAIFVVQRTEEGLHRGWHDLI